MRKIIKIAKAELQDLFYSPIAWFLLVIFIIQTGMVFFAKLGGVTEQWEYHGRAFALTNNIFTNNLGGLFPSILGNIYMYIPLLTMSIISREYSSGSIKLLYTSPITNTEIIFGKYISIIVYALVLTFVLFIYSVIAMFVVGNIDVPLILSGLLGIFFLICTYGAVGVYVSSLTSYQIIAALGTLVILSLFNYIGSFGQSLPFFRDVTYWLSMNGRADSYIRGIISTEDLLYFIAVPLFFIYLTIIRFKLKREVRSVARKLKYYSILLGSLMILAYLSSQPIFKYYWDVARFEPNTLAKTSQGIIKELDDKKLTITTYTNIFDPSRKVGRSTPEKELSDIDYLSAFTRFKPDTKLEYKYYYSTKSPGYQEVKNTLPPNLSDEEILKRTAERYNIPLRRLHTEEEILAIEPLIAEEGFELLKVATLESGEKAAIRYYNDMIIVPNTANITASLKRLTMLSFPKVAFIEGHGERKGLEKGGKNYDMLISKAYRHALYNQGIDAIQLTLDKPVPEDISIIVIADMNSSMTDIEMKHYQDYIDRGGNLIVFGEPYKTEYTNKIIEQFGVALQPGIVVQPIEGNDANAIFTRPTVKCKEISYIFDGLFDNPFYSISNNRCAHVKHIDDKGYEVFTIFETDTRDLTSWVELEQRYFDEKQPTVNELAGEKLENKIPVMVAASREVNGKTQKIIIGGDADVISTKEIEGQYFSIGRPTQNATMVYGLFNWLSDNVAPVDERRPSPIDNEIKTNISSVNTMKIIFNWIMPAIILIFGAVLLIRRRAK